MIPRFAKRRDGNQAEIVEALERIGVAVHDASGSGDGLTDLVCAWRGRIWLVEIKNPKGRGRRLTPEQVELHSKFAQKGYTIPIVENVDQALAVFGVKPTGGTK